MTKVSFIVDNHTHYYQINHTGGPDALLWSSRTQAPPAPNEVLVAHHAIGVNFIDIYHRTGLYPVPLPSGIGLEAAGVVVEVGAQVTHLKVNDRVAYASGPLGAYSERQCVLADSVVKIPDSIDFVTAAATLLKGMTAYYLLFETYPVKPGDLIVFHAAAGGVGVIACQWAHALGAVVIGCVGSHEKVAIAQSNGCDEVLVFDEQFSQRVRALSNGEGVPVVYDSVGKDTFHQSLDCLKSRGLLVSFGNASGAVPPFDPGLLAQKGSLFFTRPTLFHYADSYEKRQKMADELFGMIAKKAVKVLIDRTLPLKDAPKAHELLEARQNRGSVVLVV